jgi:methylglyoxal synthase
VTHRERLARHELWGTGTSGGRVSAGTGLAVTRLLSGPLGGDAQIGAMIAEGRLDALIFFQDPLTALPHDVDVKALTRLATLYNIPLAVNQATADAVLAAL